MSFSFFLLIEFFLIFLVSLDSLDFPNSSDPRGGTPIVRIQLMIKFYLKRYLYIMKVIDENSQDQKK